LITRDSEISAKFSIPGGRIVLRVISSDVNPLDGIGTSWLGGMFYYW